MASGLSFIVGPFPSLRSREHLGAPRIDRQTLRGGLSFIAWVSQVFGNMEPRGSGLGAQRP